MKRLLPIFLLLAACSVQIEPLPTVVPQAVATEQVVVEAPTPVPSTQVPEPAAADRWNFLILGIDKAYWRDSDPKRPHTDFMMVVSITSGEVAEVTLIQIPRNTYIPIPNIPDDFAFGLYSEGGLGMIEGWVEQSLGLPLVGSVAMRMDSFITLIDSIGGLTIGGVHMDGLETLTFVRFDLFERPGFDAEGKHFEVLEAFAENLRKLVANDLGRAIGTWEHYGWLVETDVYVPDMLEFLFEQALPLMQGKYSVERVRLEDVLCYEDIPFDNPGTTKGLLVCDGINLHQWIQEALQ